MSYESVEIVQRNAKKLAEMAERKREQAAFEERSILWIGYGGLLITGIIMLLGNIG